MAVASCWLEISCSETERSEISAVTTCTGASSLDLLAIVVIDCGVWTEVMVHGRKEIGNEEKDVCLVGKVESGKRVSCCLMIENQETSSTNIATVLLLLRRDYSNAQSSRWTAEAQPQRLA